MYFVIVLSGLALVSTLMSWHYFYHVRKLVERYVASPDKASNQAATNGYHSLEDQYATTMGLWIWTSIAVVVLSFAGCFPWWNSLLGILLWCIAGQIQSAYLRQAEKMCAQIDPVLITRTVVRK